MFSSTVRKLGQTHCVYLATIQTWNKPNFYCNSEPCSQQILQVTGCMLNRVQMAYIADYDDDEERWLMAAETEEDGSILSEIVTGHY